MLNEEYHSDWCVIYLGPGCSRMTIWCLSQRRTVHSSACSEMKLSRMKELHHLLQHGAGPKPEPQVAVGCPVLLFCVSDVCVWSL